MSIVADIYSIPVDDGPFTRMIPACRETLASSIFMYHC